MVKRRGEIPVVAFVLAVNKRLSFGDPVKSVGQLGLQPIRHIHVRQRMPETGQGYAGGGDKIVADPVLRDNK